MIKNTNNMVGSDINEVTWVKKDLVKSLVLSALAIMMIVGSNFLLNPSIISFIK